MKHCAPLLVSCALLLPAFARGYEEIKNVPADFKVPAPLEPKAALATIKVKSGLRVELVAAEPLVMDPVHFDFGPDGKLWVVEMADYPLGMDGKGKPGGRVRYLEDRDGDGRFEHSSLFLDGLNFPTGIKAWRSGVLVVAAPEIIYAEDRDGDGRADHREVLFRGFGTGNQQHRVNGLVWGLDNMLHLANGDSGGTIESVKTGKKMTLGGFDMKIDPDSGAMALTTGRTQYGRARDDFGHWFGCHNSRPLWHIVLENKRLVRNPHVRYPSAIRSVLEQPNAPEVFPAGTPALRYNNRWSERHFTSACGIGVQRDARLGAGTYGNVFICEPVHNLVHRQVLRRDGVSFKGRRAADEQASEFLAATDQWFRPVTAQTGPDGGLWIADMYRYVIEHPEWIPKEWQAVLDLRAGHNKGRLYRVVNDACGSAVPEKMSSMSIEQLVARLSSPNGRIRDMAHQVLWWRKPGSTHPAIVAAWNLDASVLVRIHLLSLVDGLSEVPGVLLFDALESGEQPLQVHALRLVHKTNANPAVTDAIARLSQDPDPVLRFHAFMAWGEIPGNEASGSFGEAALAHADSPELQAAVLSSLLPHLSAMADAVAKHPTRGVPFLDGLFATALGADDHASLARLLQPAEAKHRATAYAAFLAALQRKGGNLADLTRRASLELKAAMVAHPDLVTQARKNVSNPALEVHERMRSLSLLGQNEASRTDDAAHMLQVLSGSPPAELGSALVRRLGELQRFDELLNAWNKVSPGIRAGIATQCLGRDEGARSLLVAIEGGTIPRSTVEAATRQQLTRHRNQEIRKQAEQLFDVDANRASVLAAFESAEKLNGNAEQGRQHFGQLCASCHRLDDVGVELGANLHALSDKSTRALMTAILDPNRAVEDKFQLYHFTLRNDRSLSGMIARESGNHIVLQGLDGKELQLLRHQVLTMENTGRSAMPEGLEAALDPQKLADLIVYVQAATGAGKTAPYGGTPQRIPGTVEAENFDEGAIGAAYADADAINHGKAYRETPVDTEKFAPASNGHQVGWTRAGEWLVYTVKVAERGTYAIEIPVASKKTGGIFHLELDGKDITGPLRIPDTGEWENPVVITHSGVTLEPGLRTLRLVLDEDGASNFVGDIDCFRFVQTVAADGKAVRPTLNVGVARVDITPKEAVPLSGFYGRTQPISEVKQKLWAKALAFDGADGKPAVIVTVDVLGLPGYFRERIVDRLPGDLQVETSHLTLSASHTHTAPHIKDVANYIDKDYAAHAELIEGYATFLLDQLVSVITGALADRRPGHLDWGQGSVGFGVNRRMLDDNGKWRGFGKNPDGPVDHALPVLRLSEPDGSPRAIYVNYACHCTTLMQATYIHGDWAGEAQAAIEVAHPGAIALVSIGCGADVGPNNHGKGNLAETKANGEMIASEVTRLFGQERLIPLVHRPALAQRTINIPYDPLPDRADWLRTVDSSGGAYRTFAEDMIRRIDSDKPIAGSFAYPIQSWTFGKDLAMVFLPGEVVIDYALRLKQEFDGSRLWVSSYANGSPGYIPSRRLYGEGGYEVDSSRYYYGQPSRLSIATEDIIVDWVKRLLPAEFRAAAAAKP